MDIRFDRNTFESVEFLIESTEIPKIKAGGSSSSNVLNRYFNALAQDIALLATRTNIVAARSSRLENGCAAQGGALLTMLQSLSTRVDSASAYDQILADLHSSFYVNTGTTTATIVRKFGQATLPVLSETDLIVQMDVYGNKYISNEVQVSYFESPSSGTPNVATTSLTDYVIDPEAIFMFKEDQTWLRTKSTGRRTVYVRIKAPLQFRGLTPNVLEIHPLPAFGMILKKVWYRKSGDPEDTWYSLDLSYLPQYSASTTWIDPFGPIRLHLANEAISEIAIAMDVTNVDVWGFKKIKLYHTEYESSAVLVVKDPYSRTVGDLILRGKDPSELSTLSVSKSTNQATITMTTTDSSVTPVITGVIMRVS